MPTKRRNTGPGKPGRNKKELTMPRRSHFALAPADERGEELTPRALTKQEFGRRLQALLDERGWRQSDLMRRSIEVDAAGRGLKRDAISTYINGRSFPTPTNLNIIASSLGITKEELFPNSFMNATNDEHPALELRQAAGHPGKAWVRVNRMMSFETAAQIVTLINEDDRREFERK